MIEQLIEMGFDPRNDFDAQDDSDGFGVYIARWRSPLACPFPSLLRLAPTLENAQAMGLQSWQT